MSEKDFDQTEEATPYKLEKAKEEGQVAKSNEVVSLSVYFIVIIYLYWRADTAFFDLISKSGVWFKTLGQSTNRDYLIFAAQNLLSEGLFLILPFLIVVCLTSIVSNVFQTGFVLSFSPITPDFERLNPVAGFKKFFAIKTVFDLFRTLLKLSLLISVSYLALRDLLPQVQKVAHLPIPGMIKFTLSSIISIGVKLALTLLLIAFIDHVYTRYDFAKKMRMSKRDVKDEHKNREGDPRIRSRLRELRRDMLKKSMSAKNTREADVLITNPVHLAIALKYEHGKMASPKVLAKGAGGLANLMKFIAKRNNIPIVENRTLARKLYKQIEIEQHVPEHLYAEVAKIMVWVFALQKLHQQNLAGVRQ